MPTYRIPAVLSPETPGFDRASKTTLEYRNSWKETTWHLLLCLFMFCFNVLRFIAVALRILTHCRLSLWTGLLGRAQSTHCARTRRETRMFGGSRAGRERKHHRLKIAQAWSSGWCLEGTRHRILQLKLVLHCKLTNWSLNKDLRKNKKIKITFF